jgi:hypothetical protein
VFPFQKRFFGFSPRFGSPPRQEVTKFADATSKPLPERKMAQTGDEKGDGGRSGVGGIVGVGEILVGWR